jgi:hypothetical protein
MAVVVRCTGCRGASQVGLEAIGLLVVCPRCQEPFLAIEEAVTVAPIAPIAEAVERRTIRAQPVRERRRRDSDSPRVAVAVPRESHDAALAPPSQLPASVLIGFALLPFAIPLLWLIGPIVLAHPPALTLAAPASLAIAASTLCLAVVFTVDWTPSTRIKGVLMLVGLSYFAGLSLYFMKKDMVHRVKEVFSRSNRWHDFKPKHGDYTVRLPVQWDRDATSPEQPIAGWKLMCYRIQWPAANGKLVTYVVGSGADEKPDAVDWYGEVEKSLKAGAAADAEFKPPAGVKTDNEQPGQEWIIDLPSERKTRIVRVYRVNGNIYYLSVEGERLEADDPWAHQFLHSLQIKPAAERQP